MVGELDEWSLRGFVGLVMGKLDEWSLCGFVGLVMSMDVWSGGLSLR